MVLMVVLRTRRIDFCKNYGASLDVFPRRSSDRRAIVVFGDDPRAGENVDGCGARSNLFNTDAVAVVGVSARAATVSSTCYAILAVVNQCVAAIIGHVAAGVIRVGR